MSSRNESRSREAPKHWAVLGGGLLGMTLALELTKAGHRVTLVEASESLGGLADAWTLGDVTWDRHYHVTLLSDTALRELLSELGLDAQIEWVKARTGFYSEGRLYPLSSSLDFLRFPLLGLLDKARLAATILRASRMTDPGALEAVSVEDWLVSWSGRRTFEKMWRPLLRSKLGDSYRRVSAVFIWATIRRLYAARREGLKQELFGYVRGGYAKTLSRFRQYLEQQGVEIRLSCPVTSVTPEEDGGLCVRWAGREEQIFDSVVLTVPAPVAAGLCPTLSGEEKQRLQGVEYQGIVCASLLLRKPLANYYVTNILDHDIPFTGVIEMSTLVDRTEFGGNCLTYLPKYVASDDPIFALPDETIREQCLASLARMYPHFSRGDVLAFRVSRVRRVFALPTLHYSSRLPAIRTSVPGVFILNSSHIVSGTLNVEETIRLARRHLPLLLRPVDPEHRFSPEPAYETSR